MNLAQKTSQATRKAVETDQLSEVTSLVREFRSSDAYQWAHGSRTASTSGFESSYRDAVDHQSSSENAFSRAKELARTAQFMREWSAGAQTDFTNYAARRLSERGLLREDDPVKLQRAVTEIAFAYAKGGDVGTQFVPGDNPLAPSRPLPHLLGWPSSSLREDFEQTDSSGNTNAMRIQAATNDAAVQEHQSRQRVTPGQAVGNNIASRVSSSESLASATLHQHRREVSQEQGSLSEDYNATVQAGKISSHHGGNRAVWDTVGAQTDNRAKLGTPPERPSIGEWHLNKDGVPVVGPKREAREVVPPATKAEHAAGPEENRRPVDEKGTRGNR